MNEDDINHIRKASAGIGEKNWLLQDTINKQLEFYQKIKPTTIFSSEEVTYSGKAQTTQRVILLDEPAMRQLNQNWVDSITSVIYKRGMVAQELIMDDLVEALKRGRDAKPVTAPQNK
jgi:hypothetical protein